MAEGMVEWEGHRTWYRVDGDLSETEKAPIVILHGGPGAAHDYVESIAELAVSRGRPCILYDQLGCGRSQHLRQAPAEFWTVALFRRELVTVLDRLGVANRYHLLGHLGRH